MSVRILYANRDTYSEAALYCSTTDTAFGPIFHGDDDHDAEERAEAFLDWLHRDARQYNDSELSAKYSEWLDKEKEYWAEKEVAEKAALED